MDLQRIVDMMGEAGRMSRKNYHLTLGGAIKAMEDLPPATVVRYDYSTAGPTHPHSYRGYYSDLAFESGEGVTVEQFRKECQSALDTTFEGYKGGDFLMGADTPLWNSGYGTSNGGRAIIGLSIVGDFVVLTTREVD